MLSHRVNSGPSHLRLKHSNLQLYRNPLQDNTSTLFYRAMSLDDSFATIFSSLVSLRSCPLSTCSNFQHPQEHNFRDTSVFDGAEFGSQATSPELSQPRIPQFVQPQELHTSSAPTESSSSPQSRQASLDSLSNLVAFDRQQIFRPLSVASGDIKNDTYRPRNNPARRRKSTTSRVTPRSEKHARELKLNRKAATKYRNRQRAFVENLQKRCRREEEKMHVQTSLVHVLHDEVVALREEAMRQSFRGCHLP
jgi:flagellum-specific peptidoglycan hydrolase FlgJ